MFWQVVRRMPLAVLVGSPVAVFTTYAIAVVKGHVYPLFPYVSDAATTFPESSIFTFFLSLSAFSILITAYVRYRELTELVILKPSVKIKPVWNKVSYIIANMTCLGLVTVISFQELSDFAIHCIGAVTCFFSGSVYFVFQTVFTRRAYREEKVLFYVRVFLCLLIILSLIGAFSPIYFALKQFTGDNVLMWSEKDGGYNLHLLSTFSEWIMIFSFVLFVGTFYWDFTKFEMEPPVIKFKNLKPSEDERAPKQNPKV